jgi:hypothetical protein
MQNHESIVRTKENNKVKYVCKVCDYVTYKKTNINKHFNTIKHKLKKATKSSPKATKSSPKVASNYEYFCELCNYKTKRSNNFERHCSGKPHQEKVSTSEQQVSTSEQENQEKNEYFCEHCNYKTDRHDNFERYCSIKSHHKKLRKIEGKLRKIEGTENDENDEIESIATENYKVHQCEFCYKEYKYSSGLSKHRKRCRKYILQKNIDDKLENIVTSQTNLETKFETENVKINEKIDELASKPYTINNTMNNTVNIETFLNTECSGAMNFLDFIQSLTITQDDIIRMSKTGFIKSYAELVTQKIKDMDIKDRPAHCTNKRQMFFFLKHNNIWTDDKEFKIFNKSINLLKDKECEEWYNYSVREREKNYVSDADVNNRANAISELAKMNDESLFTKIIKKASTELFLSKKDL